MILITLIFNNIQHVCSNKCNIIERKIDARFTDMFRNAQNPAYLDVRQIFMKLKQN